MTTTSNMILYNAKAVKIRQSAIVNIQMLKYLFIIHNSIITKINADLVQYNPQQALNFIGNTLLYTSTYSHIVIHYFSKWKAGICLLLQAVVQQNLQSKYGITITSQNILHDIYVNIDD